MISIRRAVVGVIAAFALVGLTACTAGQGDEAASSTPGSSDAVATPIADLSTLEDSRWELIAGRVDGDELSLPASPAVTIMFADGDGDPMLFANACNSLSGLFVDWPERFSVRIISGTEMGCDDDLMAIDDALYAGLPRVDQVAGDSSAITLTGDDVEFEFRAFPVPEPAEVFATLADRKWQLVSGTVDDTALELPTGKPITFAVTTDDQGELYLGIHACNSGGIALEDYPDGPMLMTQMACIGEIGKFDGLVSNAVASAKVVGSMDEILVMSGDNFSLQWSGIPLTAGQ